MSAKHRHYAAAALAAAAFVVMLKPGSAPDPTPAPQPPSGLSLSGLFIGPTAADDAAILSALCDELALIIEADGKREQPRLKTGVQLDELRVAARENRTRGVSIGARQPKVRDAIDKFLTDSVGVSGGPVTAEQRAKWSDAFHEIAKAAGSVTR